MNPDTPAGAAYWQRPFVPTNDLVLTRPATHQIGEGNQERHPDPSLVTVTEPGTPTHYSSNLSYESLCAPGDCRSEAEQGHSCNDPNPENFDINDTDEF